MRMLFTATNLFEVTIAQDMYELYVEKQKWLLVQHECQLLSNFQQIQVHVQVHTYTVR